MKDTTSEYLLHSDSRIGHVHLKVANLERSINFYTQIIGFEVMSRWENSAAFLSAGGYHHHLGLNTWESADGTPPPHGTTGLYHFAVLLPSRRELARIVKRILDNKWTIDGAADHGVSEAIYLRDPDKNGIELYIDRPKDQWPRNQDGSLIMYTKPLNVDSLLTELH